MQTDNKMQTALKIIQDYVVNHFGESQVIESVISKFSGENNIDEKLDDGKTLLHSLICADLSVYSSDESKIESFRYEAVCKILNLKADPSIGDSMGRTPLHYAVIWKKYDIAIRLLTQNGNAVHAYDSKEKLPIDYFDPNTGDAGWTMFYLIFGRMQADYRNKYIDSISKNEWGSYAIKKVESLRKRARFSPELFESIGQLLRKIK